MVLLYFYLFKVCRLLRGMSGCWVVGVEVGEVRYFKEEVLEF